MGVGSPVPPFTRGYMAKRDKGGMGVFDARGHLDKNDPGMPQLFRMLKKKKEKPEPKKEEKSDEMMNHLQDFVK